MSDEPLNLTIEEMEVFRDTFNADDNVITRTAPRFYHFTKNGNDAVYDTQALDGGPYVLARGLTFEAYCLDNDIVLASSRALMNGTRLTRVEADEFGLAKIVEWIKTAPEALRLAEKTHR